VAGEEAFERWQTIQPRITLKVLAQWLARMLSKVTRQTRITLEGLELVEGSESRASRRDRRVLRSRAWSSRSIEARVADNTAVGYARGHWPVVTAERFSSPQP
jgi:hypothetical protein